MRTARSFIRLLVFALLLPFTIVSPRASDVLAPFPLPTGGQTRFVIRLDPMADESLLRVEMLVGKEMTVDCNRQHFVGKVREETVAGWGYSYFTVDEIRGPAGTLMACPRQASRQAFVSVGGGPHWTRYNSRLPLVVYVPDGFEVRYRLWSTGEQAHEASRH